MALLKKVERVATEQRHVRIPCTTAGRFSAYAEYLNRSENEIIAELLEIAMKKDPEFMAQQGKVETKNHNPKTMTTGGGNGGAS